MFKACTPHRYNLCESLPLRGFQGAEADHQEQTRFLEAHDERELALSSLISRSDSRCIRMISVLAVSLLADDVAGVATIVAAIVATKVGVVNSAVIQMSISISLGSSLGLTLSDDVVSGVVVVGTITIVGPAAIVESSISISLGSSLGLTLA